MWAGVVLVDQILELTYYIASSPVRNTNREDLALDCV